MSKPLIIINNAAAKAGRAWPLVRARLLQNGIDFDYHETLRAGDATLRTRDALRVGVTTIAIVGGDGTLSEAAEGFFEFDESLENFPKAINPSACLAVLPAGTGDDFARGLSVNQGERASLDEWVETFTVHCQAANRQRTRPVDMLYGRCDGFKTAFICMNASTMGIGGETASRVAAQGNVMRRFSGKARFASAALAALASWRERRVRVSLDDDREVIEGMMNLAAVANALYAGGGMKLSPEARLDDGKLDVVTASGLSRTNVMRELARIHKGGHIGNPKVRIAQGEKVRVETFAPEDAMLIEADGNVRGLTPVEFRVMPKALRIVVR